MLQLHPKPPTAMAEALQTFTMAMNCHCQEAKCMRDCIIFSNFQQVSADSNQQAYGILYNMSEKHQSVLQMHLAVALSHAASCDQAHARRDASTVKSDINMS